MVKIATETSMMQSLTPIFDASCPSFLSAIKIHTLDLGDISPTIPGVKVSDVVMFDVWNDVNELSCYYTFHVILIMI